MSIDAIRLAREAGFRSGSIQLSVGDPIPFIAPISATNCLVELERSAALATADLKAANAELLEALRQLLHDDSEQYAWEVWEKHGGAA